MNLTKDKIFTLSNFISFFRLLMAVPFWILMDNLNSGNTRIIVFSFCLFAAFTDILDGWLARKFNQVSELGKIIDPLADKVAMGAVVIQLFLAGELSTFFFTVMILRDVLIFLGGIIVTKIIGKVLPSNILGKITVLVIGLFVLLTLLNIDKSGFIYLSIYWLSIILIFISFFAYAWRAFEFISRKRNGSV